MELLIIEDMGFSQIEVRELPTWVKVLKRESLNASEMLNELTLIDDLLVLQKSQSLLNRNKGLKNQLEARIGKDLKHQLPNLNRK